MATQYSEGFWITLGGLVFGFLGLTIRACMKSRCSVVSLGCLRIERDVVLEEKEAELAMVQRQQSKDNESDINRIML